MALFAQAKLLRAIETREFRPIGARTDITSEFRLVAATNVPVDSLTSQHAFRKDLKFRLTGVVIRIPPLDAHLADVPELARHFASMMAVANRAPVDLSDAALDALRNRSWPGNVRELRHVVEYAVAIAREAHIGQDEIAALFAQDTATHLSPTQDFEKRRLLDLLEDSRWNVNRVASSLGLHRASLYRRMKQFGIQAPKTRRSLENYDEASRVIRVRQSATSRDFEGPVASEVVELQ